MKKETLKTANDLDREIDIYEKMIKVVDREVFQDVSRGAGFANESLIEIIDEIRSYAKGKLQSKLNSLNKQFNAL